MQNADGIIYRLECSIVTDVHDATDRCPAMAGPHEKLNFYIFKRALQQSYEEAARLDCSFTFCCTMASVIPPEILAPASSTYDMAAVAACLGFP
ncbi:hypothetical protein LWI28_017014 [Acer negundo]|uniref:Uncharacterized protein n=1 Tax=Acer negundo TaxID=4023 RepID=A0AAD5J5V1_ACENE|nr:hypothetical protein LWI28_017014 [Acer negundo]